jgi:hypothetical protein
MHRQSTFRHQFLDIAQAQRETQIPPHSGDDNSRLEPALTEKAAGEQSYRYPTRSAGATLPDSPIRKRDH